MRVPSVLILLFTSILGLTVIPESSSGFSPILSPISFNGRICTNLIPTKCATTTSLQLSNNAADSVGTLKATLDENTTWRLRFALNGVPTTSGNKVGELFNVDVQFILEEGFEPPQGTIQQVLSPAQEENDNKNVQYLKVKSGRWKLSEDPEDRKDGLWVWGLFKEPLYPFMLLQLDTEEYVLPSNNSGDEEEEKNAIEPLSLYAQINHKRDKTTGEVELEAATLNLREIESINADPFGVAKVIL